MDSYQYHWHRRICDADNDSRNHIPTPSSPTPSTIISPPTVPVSPIMPMDTNNLSAAPYFFSNEGVVQQFFVPAMKEIPYHHLLVPFHTILTYPMLDNNSHASLTYGLYIRLGDIRFPIDTFLPDTQSDVEGCFRELNIQTFFSIGQWDSFPFWWESSPVKLTGNLIVHPEHEFRGAKWRLYPGPEHINRIISRGTVFHLGDTNTNTYHYMATVCRAVNNTVAVIQLNAYKKSQHRPHTFNPTWPTLTMVIPHCYNQVPMPESHVKNFDLEKCGLARLTTLYRSGLIAKHDPSLVTS